MSAERPSRTTPSGPRVLLPRWFAGALALWVLVAAVTVANATALPVRAEIVMVALGVVAILHGVIHRRWTLALVWVGLAFALAIALVIGIPGVEVKHAGGPAGSVGVRVIWIAVALVVGACIAYGTRLHREMHLRRRADPVDIELTRLLQEDDRDALDRLDRRLSAIEDLLGVERSMDSTPPPAAPFPPSRPAPPPL